jgi:hypothetical protein
VNGVEKRNVSAQATFMQYFGLPNIAFKRMFSCAGGAKDISWW